MAQAIVTALDRETSERVEELWGELRAVFGLGQFVNTRQPHFTYHVAETYDAGRIDAVLRGIADRTAPFAATSGDPAILRGQQALLYLPVEPEGDVRRLHDAVWLECASLASGAKQAYTGATWAPHISIAMGPLDEAQAPDVLAFLAGRPCRWALPVGNVCFVPDTRRTSGWRRFDFAG